MRERCWKTTGGCAGDGRLKVGGTMAWEYSARECPLPNGSLNPLPRPQFNFLIYSPHPSLSSTTIISSIHPSNTPLSRVSLSVAVLILPDALNSLLTSFLAADYPYPTSTPKQYVDAFFACVNMNMVLTAHSLHRWPNRVKTPSTSPSSLSRLSVTKVRFTSFPISQRRALTRHDLSSFQRWSRT